MLSNEQLEAFVVTVEKGSFSAAARELNKRQSAISQLISNLEIDLNYMIFDRSHRYPVLTEQGKTLLPFAQATLAQLNRFKQKASSLEIPEDNKLRLAIDEGISTNGVVNAVNSLTLSFPCLEFELLSASSADIIDMVAKDEAHTGIVFSESNYPKNIDFDLMGNILFQVFVGVGAPLAATEITNLDEFRLHRQLVIGARNKRVTLLNEPHSPQVWYADNYHLLLSMVKANMGWALLPETIADIALKNKEITALSCANEALRWYANIDIIQSHKSALKRVNKCLRKKLLQ